jgi:major membrane immunogen (membrane-anchored lipoprotein)
MAGKAAKKASVLVTGAPVATSSAATTTADNKTYYLSSTSLNGQPWDLDCTVTVRDGASTATGYTVDRLAGKITFSSSASRTIKIDTEYLTLGTLAQCHDFSMTMGANLVDVSVIGSSWEDYIQGQRSARGTLSRWRSTSIWAEDVLSATSEPNPFVLEYYCDASSTSYDIRTWALMSRQAVRGAVKSAVDETVEWQSAEDVDHRGVSFGD